MATKEFFVGSVGPLLYDDTATYPDTEPMHAIRAPQVYVEEAPTEDYHAVRKDYADGLVSPDSAWPIGSVFLSVVSTNPATLLGFGTWSQIAQGQFLVGFKTGDSDFGTVEATGGNKNHTHATDITAFNSAGPDATAQVQSGTGTVVGSFGHVHSVDPPSTTSGNNSALPPFCVIYVWKRTA